MRLRYYLLLIVSLIMYVTGIVTPSTAFAQTLPAPDTNPKFGNCTFLGFKDDFSSTLITNTFTIEKPQYSIQYKNPVTITAKDLGAETSLYGNALVPKNFTLLQMQPSALSDKDGSSASVGAYYLLVYGTNSRNARVVYHSTATTLPSGVRKFETIIAEDGSYWIFASGNSNTILGRYIQWIYGNPPMNFSNAIPGITSNILVNSVTDGSAAIKINEVGASGIISSFYYVAKLNHGAAISATDSANLEGFVYRNDKDPGKYILVAGDNLVETGGGVRADYNASKSVNWSQSPTYTIVNNFVSPDVPDPYYTVSGVIDFSDLLTQKKITKDQLTNLRRDMTVEIRLGSDGSGPFINREFSTLVDDSLQPTQGPTYANHAKGDFDQIYVVGPTQADSLDIPRSLLFDGIQYYGHKALGSPNLSDGTAPFIEASAPLNLNSSFRSDSANKHKVAIGTKTQTGPIWVTATLKDKLTHDGAEEEKGEGESLAAGLSPTSGVTCTLGTIPCLILDALKSIAQLIQQAIIYVVSWLISITEQYVPI